MEVRQKLVIIALYTNKQGDRRFPENNPKLRHGREVWAEVKGLSGRIPLHFNEYLPDGTPWIDRFVPLADLRATKRVIRVDDDFHVNTALRMKIRAGLVTLVRRPISKTESVGRREDPKTALPIGSGQVYA